MAPLPAFGEPVAQRPGLRPGAGEPVEWQPGWHRFGWQNGVGLAVGAGAIMTGLAVGPDREAPRQWIWAVDEDVRSALRVEARGARNAVRRTSDVLLGANLSYAFVADAWLNAGSYRQSPDVAWQLTLINAQVLAVITSVQLWTANLVSRERPYGRLCGTDELSAGDSDCTSDYRYRSFFSGHTSFSFALASATCTHHAYLPLHGGRAEWMPCATGLVLAAATGVGRIASDQHYASDVVVGALAGSAVGWLVPWLHYSAGARSWSQWGGVQVALAPLPRGVALSGLF